MKPWEYSMIVFLALLLGIHVGSVSPKSALPLTYAVIAFFGLYFTILSYVQHRKGSKSRSPAKPQSE